MTVLSVGMRKAVSLPAKTNEPEFPNTTRASDDKGLKGRRKRLLAIFEKTPRGERLLDLKEAETAVLGIDGDGIHFEFFYEYRPQAKCEAA